jgi:hypothetical protein
MEPLLPMARKLVPPLSAISVNWQNFVAQPIVV